MVDIPRSSDPAPAGAASTEERRQLLESLPVGVGAQCDGRIVYLNPAGAQILGGEDPSEFLGQPIMDFVHPADRAAVSARVDEMTANGLTALERRYVFLDRTGREVPVVVTTTRITFRGRPGTQIVFAPPGLQREEHEELRRLRKAVDSSSEIVFMTDRQGVFTFVNPEFTRVYGHEREELLGKKTPRVLKGGLIPPEQYELFWKTILAGHVVRGELINKTQSGQLLTIDSSANPFFDEAGEVSGFIAVQRDVTARKEGERLLNLMRFSLDHSLDASYWFSADGAIRLANETASALLGFSREELAEMRVWDLDPKMAPDSWSTAWESAKRKGSARRQTLHRGKDGVDIPVEVSSRFIEFDGAEYLFTSAHDTRERDVLTAQLQQAQKMEAVGRLAGGIAHDFNNLLAVILCYADFVGGGVEAHDPIAADIAEIRGAADRAVGLTRQLLAFSRKQVMQTTTFDLRDVVAGLEKILRRVIGEDVILEVRVGDEPLLVEADIGQIEQVLMNLAVNSRDAMPEGGVLEITIFRCDVDGAAAAGAERGAQPMVCLSLRDTGIGMDPQTCARVFEPFFTTKPAGRGTGLGLSTAYGIVKQSGGTIEITSQLGAGTTVSVCLPRASADAASPSERTASRAPAGTTRGTVLLVEDEDAVRLVAQRSLDRLGLTVLTASGPGEALLIHEQHPGEIDLLLSDVVMPSLNGVELARRLLARQPTLRVLLMTGYVDDERLGDFLAASRFEVMRKPFTPTYLRDRVRAALAGPRARS